MRAVSAIACLPSPQYHPEDLGPSGPPVFPDMRTPAVQVGAVARLQEVGFIIVMETDLAFDDIEQLHLPGLEDYLLGAHALAARPERGHHRPDLAMKEAGAEHVPLLGGPVERHHRIVLAAGDVEAPIGPGLEERGDGDAQRARELTQGMQRGAESTRLDLREHARGQAGLLRELALLQGPLRAQRLDPLSQRDHASSPLPARRRSARST